jgi:hypothetical protein
MDTFRDIVIDRAAMKAGLTREECLASLPVPSMERMDAMVAGARGMYEYGEALSELVYLAVCLNHGVAPGPQTA